ncbi:hypothetical protein HanRHA438_Chr10g0436351 [Helianthus annuus]|nr:hypothetical protein HanRHA438_Chr10g0436351 [Helianthus annuus]
MIGYNNSSNSDGEKQLYGNNRVNLPNKRPPELRRLQHHRVQPSGWSSLQICLPKRRLIPHV